MFNQNEWVVYPGAGVYRVSGTTVVSGKPFFKLSADGCPTIMIPSGGETHIVRKLANLNDITTAYRILKSPVNQDLPKRLPLLEKIIVSKFKTGSIFEVADMVSTLARYKKHRRLSVTEMRYLDMGLKQLVEEVSLAKGISKEDASHEIMSCLN
jgi:RNA polymerase-interacting CarD/CdnL/TRCF family regulator